MIKNGRLLILKAACLILVAVPFASGQRKYFTNWPEGYSPQEVGKRVAEHFVTSPHQDPQRSRIRKSVPGTADSLLRNWPVTSN